MNQEAHDGSLTTALPFLSTITNLLEVLTALVQENSLRVDA